MAQTAAQKKKAADLALLKKAQAALAKSRTDLTRLEDEQALLNPTAPSSVNTTTLAGIQAASARPTAQQSADDAYFGTKVGTTGKTQAQLDAAAGAAATVKSINESYSGFGISSKIDPKTGRVVTTKTDGTVLTNNAPGSPFAPAAPTDDKPEKTEISAATRDAFAMHLVLHLHLWLLRKISQKKLVTQRVMLLQCLQICLGLMD